MATQFMNLTLPTPSVTLGPQWANELNTALNIIDEHDHSNGKGTTIKTAGIEINANLDFNEFTLFGLKSVKLATQSGTLTGATNAQSLFSYNGDLYYVSGSGTAVPITSGASVVSVPGAMTTVPYSAVASSPYSATTLDVLLAIDTSSARTIILPAAASTSAGRIYIIKDASGLSETNNVTVNVTGSDTVDGASSVVLSSNYGSVFVVSNGADRWTIV